MQSVKCVVVGDGGVGKTCMLIAYANNYFRTEYIPTLFDTQEKLLTVDGHNVILKLVDTPGQSEYSRLRALSYRDANIFLICYAIDDEVSYGNVSSFWVPELKHYKVLFEYRLSAVYRRALKVDVPIVMVGLKTDLRKYAEESIYDKMLKPEDGEKLAKAEGALKYVECSALTQKGISAVFTETVRIAINPEKYGFKKTKSRCTLL